MTNFVVIWELWAKCSIDKISNIFRVWAFGFETKKKPSFYHKFVQYKGKPKTGKSVQLSHMWVESVYIFILAS